MQVLKQSINDELTSANTRFVNKTNKIIVYAKALAIKLREWPSLRRSFCYFISIFAGPVSLHLQLARKLRELEGLRSVPPALVYQISKLLMATPFAR